MTRTHAGFVVALASAGVAIVSARAPQKAGPVFADGQAQVVPAFQDPAQWIREKLWVESEFDSDGDGAKDRMFTDVVRPKQTETEGLKVPVIYESSPYYAGTQGDRSKLWNVNQEVGDPPPARESQGPIPFKPERAQVSNSIVGDWVPRGFAVVHSEAPGTGLSQGCVTVGDAPERLAPKAVIDWLNGRAKGYTTATGSTEVKATAWSTGKVGMIGTSYNGTLPVAAAVTGVKGLEAIIPVAPNTSYYHYYRTNGLVRHPDGWLGEDIDFLYDYINSGDPDRRDGCNKRYRDGEFAAGRDRQHGDYNDFWARRDLLPLVGNIRAAVLMAHAFNDWNVVPEHSVRIYTALKGRVPLEAYYHQGGHGGDPPMDMKNKWFSHFLYGVANGVEKGGPRAFIVREPVPAPPPAAGAPPPGRGRGGPALPPTPYADYPNPAAAPVTLKLAGAGNQIGILAQAPATNQQSFLEMLIDDVGQSAAALAMKTESPNRLMFSTPELIAPVHLSGYSRITIALASNKPAANLSVYLVQLPWTDGPINTTNLITRGWADPQNAASLTRGGNYDSKVAGTPLTPGKQVVMTFDLEPDDQIVPAGKRIALMIFSSDRGFTLWPKPGTELTIDLARTQITLPVVGGAAAWTKAVSK
ncbi:MAG TPA: Xaa-Pro dipeptidyl-peptidase [Vicinamibacterales bacterium]|nr:Xaa-Pro dipeptidyl-peptidase [Vicinamibacterales bacterium]